LAELKVDVTLSNEMFKSLVLSDERSNSSPAAALVVLEEEVGIVVAFVFALDFVGCEVVLFVGCEEEDEDNGEEEAEFEFIFSRDFLLVNLVAGLAALSIIIGSLLYKNQGIFHEEEEDPNLFLCWWLLDIILNICNFLQGSSSCHSCICCHITILFQRIQEWKRKWKLMIVIVRDRLPSAEPTTSFKKIRLRTAVG
jgi:hypothetical protein